MVVSCSAYNCSQRFEKGVSFHTFPNDKILLKQWLHAMKTTKWTPSKSSRICSHHFVPDDYDQSGWSSRKTLKPDAVPSVFSFPGHLQQKTENSRPPPRKRSLVADENESEISCSNSLNEEVNEADSAKGVTDSAVSEPQLKRREHYVRDFDVSDEPTLKTVQCLKLSKSVIDRKNKQIKMLQQSNRRLKKKLFDLQTLVKHLQQKNLASEEASATLLASVPESAQTIFKQMLKGSCERKCPDELKCFALTLHFYSPKAYKYVRNTLNKCLPHCRTIQKWYENIHCKPGFSLNALEA